MADLRLEMNVSHRLILLHAKERRKARVRDDYTLVIGAAKFVDLNILANGTSHIRATHKSTSGFVEELTEFVGYRLGFHETTVGVGTSSALATKVLAKDLVGILNKSLYKSYHITTHLYKASLLGLHAHNCLL